MCDRLYSAAGRYDIPPHPWHSSIRRAGKVAPRDRTFHSAVVCDAGRWIGCDDELHNAQEGKAFGHGGQEKTTILATSWRRARKHDDDPGGHRQSGQRAPHPAPGSKD